MSLFTGSRAILHLLALTLAIPALAGDPEVTVTRIENVPNRLFYFDDTPVSRYHIWKAEFQVILIHDPVTLQIRRSDDEGKTWNTIDSISKVVRLVSHPHSNNMAFAIGNDKTHWVTYNRGDSWQSFDTPREASLIGDVLSFHAEQEGWILFQGVACEDTGGGKWGGGETCWDETYYTTDAFRGETKLLLEQTSQCTFARSTKNTLEAPEKMILCVAFDQNTKAGGMRSYKDSMLYSSDDWFAKKKFVDMGIGKRARGVVGLGVVSKFMVAALKVPDEGTKRAGGDPM